MCLLLRMHPMSFQQKRGHLSAVARGREMFADVLDMTPARFDILYLLHEGCHLRLVTAVVGYEMSEAVITRRLGLARQTIWKMVERLEQLGLVTRRKDSNNHPRRNIVALTKQGISRVRQAMGAAFSEMPILPRDAPAEGAQRYWRRPELADTVRATSGTAVPVSKIGREVAKIFTSFAWKRVRGGRRGKRSRHLALLDRMIQDARELARALGDRSSEVYTLDYEPDH